MPTSAKIDSHADYTGRLDVRREVRAAQPNWVLRRKLYRTLPPGLPDTAINEDWERPLDPAINPCHAARVKTAANSSAPSFIGTQPSLHSFRESMPTVRFMQSATGVLESQRQYEDSKSKTAEVLETFRTRPYSAQNSLQRVEPTKPAADPPAAQQTAMYARATTPLNSSFRTPGVTADHSCCEFCQVWAKPGYPHVCRQMPIPDDQKSGFLFPST